MFAIRRLLAVGSVLSLVAVLAGSRLWGEGRDGKSPMDSTRIGRPADVPIDPHAAEERNLARFADRPLLLYHRTDTKETLLALQVKPALRPAPARPRDYVVLIDTAAHMTAGDLKAAQALTRKLVDRMGEGDRAALWTVNTRHHDLSNGLQPAGELKAAFKKLDKEYPAGAVNLRATLPEAIKLFPGGEGRQRVLLFFGSGQSIAGPVDDELRAAFIKEMVANQIAFYCTPLGVHLDPYNLHGFTNSTGGQAVRYGIGATPDKWVADLLDAVGQPVLYGAELRAPAGLVEVMPSKLPPLRPDVPILVVGKFDAARGKTFDYTLRGQVAGDPREVPVSLKMATPDEDNFFLVNIFEQWKAQKDRPALLPADRTLASSYETNQLARADLLAQAEWALEKRKFEVAERLYRQALKADPTSARARGGLQLIADLRSGKKTIDDVKKLIQYKEGDFTRLVNGKVVKLSADQIFAEPDRKDQPLAPDQAPRNLQNEVRARQAIVDQEQRRVVDEAIRQAGRLVATDPDGAHDFLKRTLDGVRTNPDISNEAKASLSDRLARALQAADIRGAVVKRDQAEALSLLAAANARTTLSAVERLEQNRVRERMRVYHNLMDQAREQQAYRHAQAIRKDLVDQGITVPPAVTAGYAVGLAGYHLREEQELRRIREERWLATLLEVERSHVPFPDEPPVEFPPPAVWRELSERRKAKYEVTEFGAGLPARGVELQRLLSKPVRFDGIDDPKVTLSEALDALAKRYNLSFDINDKAFEFEQVKEVGKQEIAQPTPIPEMHTTLSTILRKILRRVSVPSGATYIIRRDVIEITTGTFAGAEKTLRVYPVADLVTPIPIAVNPQSLIQSAQFSMLGFGGMGGLFGVVGGLNGLGIAGAMVGGLGMGGLAGLGGLGGLGGGLGGIGGLGGLNGIAGVAGIGGVGAQGFNQLGAAGGFRGNFQGQGNQGFGGIVGFGGQQLGQFGNLGGQFGLQGGNQSQILINLIRQVVGKPKDWAINFDPVTGQPINPLDDNAQAEGLQQENNQLGFYPPAQALAVKASSTVHTRPSNLIAPPAPGGAAGAFLPRDRGDRLAAGNNGGGNKVRVGGQGDERPDDKDPRNKLDPETVWQDALVRAKKDTNPGLVIATADFLVLANKPEHAAEFLKADLREGIVAEPWVYKSLALALRMSGGSAEDIERAEVSTADMEPKSAAGYLQAAQALAQDEKYGLALAFCRQAALLEPGTPHAYADALRYAELARDAEAMEWAAGNLLRHDWPVNNQSLQDRAAQKIEALAKLLQDKGRKDEAERLQGAVALKRRRDLVIKLNWQGDADLDLHVLEPTGSMCSPLHRQTVGGGVLIGDSLADMTRETYLAAEAFSGDYEVEVEKVWGHPLGNKAQLRIIRHQGTPDETEQLLTVELKSQMSRRIKVRFDGGRRTETAYVPPPDAHKDPEPAPTAATGGADKVLQQLRILADPDVVGVGRSFQAAAGSTGSRPVLPSAIAAGKADPKATPDDRVLYQTRVRPFVQNAMDVTAQAVISADRRYVRLSLTPMFNTVTGVQTAPVLVNPLIPGGRR